MSATPKRPRTDSSQAQFWRQRWEAGQLPWDLGRVPPNLLWFLTRNTVSPGRVLIPGCGTGYEVRAFHQAGYDVQAIDFAEPAVARARQELGPLAAKVCQADFFYHDFGPTPFDLVYERAFLCSIPPQCWPEYAARMAALLRPGGRLVGLFLYGQEPEPPPYPLTLKVAQTILAPHFRLVLSEAAAPDTVPLYRGMEQWQEWERLQP